MGRTIYPPQQDLFNASLIQSGQTRIHQPEFLWNPGMTQDSGHVKLWSFRGELGVNLVKSLTCDSLLFFRDTQQTSPRAIFRFFLAPRPLVEASGIRTSGTNGLRSLAGYGLTDRSFNPCHGKGERNIKKLQRESEIWSLFDCCVSQSHVFFCEDLQWTPQLIDTWLFVWHHEFGIPQKIEWVPTHQTNGQNPKVIGFEMALYLQITKAFHYLPTQSVGQHNHLV